VDAVIPSGARDLLTRRSMPAGKIPRSARDDIRWSGATPPAGRLLSYRTLRGTCPRGSALTAGSSALRRWRGDWSFRPTLRLPALTHR
jgi:hypothetical protein